MASQATQASIWVNFLQYFCLPVFQEQNAQDFCTKSQRNENSAVLEEREGCLPAEQVNTRRMCFNMRFLMISSVKLNLCNWTE